MKYPTSRQIAQFERDNQGLGYPRGLAQALRINNETLGGITGMARGESKSCILNRRRKYGFAQVSSRSARRTKIA